MKLTAFILTVAFLNVYATGVSQSITFSGKNVPLKKVFTAVKDQTGYVIFGNADVIQEGTPVTLTVYDMPLKDFLDLAMKNLPLNYRIADKTIMISRKPLSQQPLQGPAQVVVQNVSGTVKDSSGRPIPGATVMLQPGGKGASTNSDGVFVIPKVEPGTYNIAVSFIGFHSFVRRITVTGNAPLELGMITLGAATASLKDVVISNGLFTRSRESFTGAVSTFSGTELKRVSNQNVLAAMAILDPSIRIVDNVQLGSDPNKLPEIILRGPTGLPDVNATYQNAPNMPLFILDGFETTLQKIYDLNMNIVASITLLKDASAKAIYGSKAGNGVVVIETLRPMPGKLRLSYTGSMDITAPDLNSYNMTNSSQKLEAELLAGKYYSAYPERQYELMQLYSKNRQAALDGVNTYWLSQPLQNGVGQKHNIYLDGGDEAMRYAAGLNYNRIAGVMKGSDRTTISGLLNLSYRKNNVSFRNNLSIDKNTSRNSPYGLFGDYTKLNPYWRIKDSANHLIPVFDGNVANPLYNATLNIKDQTDYTTIIENFYGEWEVVKNLRVTGRVGLNLTENSSDYFIPASHSRYLTIQPSDPMYLLRGEYTASNGKANTFSTDLGLNYSFMFGKNQVFTNVFYSLQQQSQSTRGMTMIGFPDDKMDDITFGSQYQIGSKAVGGSSKTRNVGVTTALNYSYDNRFLADLSYRANGSSQFGSNNRWGNFWSVGLGWNVHYEKFMENLKFIDQMKIRGSIGTTGTQNFSSYQSIATYGYITDRVYNGELGVKLLAAANPNLKWQQAQDKNVGVDMNLFKVLGLRADFYITDTKDLLSDQTIAPSTGFNSYKENVGEQRNQGFQVTVSGRIFQDVKRRAYITAFANIAHNTNKIRKVSNALAQINKGQDSTLQSGGLGSNRPVTRFAEGQSTSAIWAVPSRGIDPANGSEIYVKRNGELTYVWSADDQVVVGDNLPKYNGSFGINSQLRGLTLNLAFSYRLGGQIYNQTLVDKVENADINYNVDVRLLEGRWRTPGQQALYKNIADLSATRPTSRFVQDQHELILSSINFGYDFSQMRFVRSLKMNRLAATVTMNELARLSRVQTERGLDYPFARTMSFSLQANF
ncbi:SusC/RagA family TonB-linked outer membrane protein [Chitinophaga horti]|uniref:SusC/RagA family TonB-linked outer membrane protein n=1 Tax=Chitinophaga horti TaxID=2920382 RepID=A0ABY6J7B6_9BACT|nr:SusC/RagA family TonB-linked outer membrane protein [Chitinophaga horti]UYQ95487.1 SusC/RagA family TonB-linked outer membrane protein [Chitinophaga horti]